MTELDRFGIAGGSCLDASQDLDVSFVRAYARELALSSEELLQAALGLKKVEPSQLSALAQSVHELVAEVAEELARHGRSVERDESLAQRYRSTLPIDEDTGLYSANQFHKRLVEEVERARRYGRPLCLALFDIERLAAINEALGVEIGDQILARLAETLASHTRQSEVAFRLGPDDFALILTETAERDAFTVAERLRTLVLEALPSEIKDQFEAGRVSVGLSSVQGKDDTAEQLAERARAALEDAKGTGGNVSRSYSPPHVRIHRATRRRVAVTGMGVVSPIGTGLDRVWGSIREGRSGVSRITYFDPEFLPSQMAGQVTDFDATDWIEPRDVRRMGKSTIYAYAAALQALEDAGIDLKAEDPSRVGVLMGSAVGGIEFGEEAVTKHYRGGERRLSPFLAIALFSGALSSELSVRLGVTGPSWTLSTGCTAASDALGEAANLIRKGEVDLAIAGGAEAPITRLILGSFCAIRATSTRNDSPSTASRPFDATRDGFVLGEGSGVLILEELERSLERAARIYGEIAGYGATDDAYHMTQPAPDGEAAGQALQLALADAQLHPAQVDYVNAHGSSTPLNDKTETMILKKVFGSHARKLAISSTKSMIGHPVGASGAIELIVTLLSMQNNVVPPTINYEHPDPECDLDYVPNVMRSREVNVALSNSFGFGGKNSAIVVRRFTGL